MLNEMVIEPVFTPEEVAKALKVTGGTIRNLIKKGQLFAIKVGDQYRIPRHVLEGWFSPFEGIDWESIGFGIWSKDKATKNPVRYVEKLRRVKHQSILGYLEDLEKSSSL